MILINLCCPALFLPLICAATLPVQQSEIPVDSLTDDKFSVPGNGTWERVVVGVPGQDSVPILVRCNAVYGAGVEARSCFNALSFAPRSEQQEIWFANNLPPGIQGNRLPVVVISNDTSCYIIPRLHRPYTIGLASARNISEAARAVIMNCVIPRRIGGVAGQIGGDNKLAVVVYGGNPYLHLQCGPPIRAMPRSCGYILDEMRRSDLLEIFARPGSLGLTVALPLTLRSPDGLCQFVLDNKTPFNIGISTTWSRVWLAAEAITAGCVRAGKGGRAPAPGRLAGSGIRSEDLVVTIMDEPKQLALPGAENDRDPRASTAATI